MRTPLFLIPVLLLGGGMLCGQSGMIISPTDSGKETGASTVEMNPSTWDGRISPDGRIPEFGHTLQRGEGYLQLIVWEGRLRAYFLDKEKVVIDPPFQLLTARLTIRGRDNEFIRLTPRGQFLQGNLFLRPPLIFHTVLRLHEEGDDSEDEVHGFMFNQEFIK